MYCRNCGKEIKDSATQCPYCDSVIVTKVEEKASVGWGVLGFCCPLIGLILYLIWKDTDHANAKMAAKGAIVAVAFFLVCRILDFAVMHL